MSQVYEFIKDGLEKFPDSSIFHTELRGHCLKLNELLNNVTIPDYNEHLQKNAKAIRNEIAWLNISIRDSLFIDLSEIVNLVNSFQLDRKIYTRDHYYHSIQCFLLSIALFNNYHSFPQPPEDIIAILYSLTMFHDIGYLYKSKEITEDKINKYFMDLFLSDINTDRKFDLLCLWEEDFQSSEVRRAICDSTNNSNDIAHIWSSEEEIKNRALSKIGIEPAKIPGKCKEGHAYKGALLLARISMTKSLVLDLCASEFLIDIHNEKNNWFNEIVIAIYNHSREPSSPLLNITKDFYSFYLMIIDELQTYGRLLSKDIKYTLINPRDVGFHWDTANPKKLVLDIIPQKAGLVKKCNAHDRSMIKQKLVKKINEGLLGLYL